MYSVLGKDPFLALTVPVPVLLILSVPVPVPFNLSVPVPVPVPFILSVPVPVPVIFILPVPVPVPLICNVPVSVFIIHKIQYTIYTSQCTLYCIVYRVYSVQYLLNSEYLRNKSNCKYTILPDYPVSNSTYKRMYYSTKAKLSSLWNKAGRPKSAEIIKSIINCQLTLPCITRWHSFYDSLVKLYKIDRDKLNKLMYELDLPEFTKSDFEFIYEYIKGTKPIAIILDTAPPSHRNYPFKHYTLINYL